MKRKLGRIVMVVLTAPALTLAISGCMFAGKSQQAMHAPLPQAAPSVKPANYVPEPQTYDFVSARSPLPRSSRPRPSHQPSSFFGGGGC